MSTTVTFSVYDYAMFTCGVVPCTPFDVTYDSTTTVSTVLNDLLGTAAASYGFQLYDVNSASCSGSDLVDTDTLDAAGVVANPYVCLVSLLAPSGGGGSTGGTSPGGTMPGM